MTEAYIYDHVRTPRGRGKAGGGLNAITPINLLTQVLEALRDRNDLDTSLVDDVVMGCVSPVGEQGANVAVGTVARGGSIQSPNVFDFSGLFSRLDLKNALEELLNDDPGGELDAYERKNFNALGNLVILNIFMPIAYYFGSLQGVDGVALGWLLLYPPLFAITQIRTSRQLGVRAVDLVVASRNAVLSAFLMLLAVLAADGLLDGVVPDVLRLALLVGLGVVIYFLASLRVNRERLNDMRALISRN